MQMLYALAKIKLMLGEKIKKRALKIRLRAEKVSEKESLFINMCSFEENVMNGI